MSGIYYRQLFSERNKLYSNGISTEYGYNRHWQLEKLGFKSPLQFREEYPRVCIKTSLRTLEQPDISIDLQQLPINCLTIQGGKSTIVSEKEIVISDNIRQ